jgi:hypothetical protein
MNDEDPTLIKPLREMLSRQPIPPPGWEAGIVHSIGPNGRKRTTSDGAGPQPLVRRHAPLLELGAAIAIAAVAVVGIELVFHRSSSSSNTASSEPPTSVPTYPLSLYPLPVAPLPGGGSISFPGTFACPSPIGLQSPSAAPTAAILASLNGLLRAPTEATSKTFADQAAWPLVSQLWSPGTVRPTVALAGADVAIDPAEASPFAPTYAKLCGRSLISSSWVASWCLSTHTGEPMTVAACTSDQPDMTNDFYFLERQGHWLLWGVQGGG